MLLALDIGNTNVVGGLYDGARLAAQWRVSTERDRTADELHALWAGVFAARHRAFGELTGACIASVVPSLTASYAALTRDLLGLETLVVTAADPGASTAGRRTIDFGLRVDTDNPVEVGADRIVNAVAARARYGAPAIVVDFGTATTFDVVSVEGNYVGGAIAPGMGPAMESLVARTSQLFRVGLQRPERAIGRTTLACMQSGVFLGYVGLVEGLLRRIQQELPQPAAVVATGGLAAAVAPETPLIQHVDPDLTLEGIRLVWERNRNG